MVEKAPEKKKGLFKRLFRFGQSADEAHSDEQIKTEKTAQNSASEETLELETLKVKQQEAKALEEENAQTSQHIEKDDIPSHEDLEHKDYLQTETNETAANLNLNAPHNKKGQDNKNQGIKNQSDKDKESAKTESEDIVETVPSSAPPSAPPVSPPVSPPILVEEQAQAQETVVDIVENNTPPEENEIKGDEVKSDEVESEDLSPAPMPKTQQSTWFQRLKKGLSNSSRQLTDNINGIFTKRKLDEDTLQDLEDILIQADLGIDTAIKITDQLADQRMGKNISGEEIRTLMADEIEKVLEPVAQELELDLSHKPHVVLMVGVNGSGKTTTIGKLSQKLHDSGYKTYLAAGDTFRAAAIEQLKIWGARTASPVISSTIGADAAGLAFDAYTQAKQEGADVLLIDTAGRLQNRKELMDELAKITRVLKKHDPDAPHTVLLTLDATTGQNALKQVEIFKDVAGVNGLVMTKLDGTARGGILVSIAAKHQLPVYFIGIGEGVEDLEPFRAKDFARSITDI